jgi:hypothetical protein
MISLTDHSNRTSCRSLPFYIYAIITRQLVAWRLTKANMNVSGNMKGRARFIVAFGGAPTISSWTIRQQ